MRFRKMHMKAKFNRVKTLYLSITYIMYTILFRIKVIYNNVISCIYKYYNSYLVDHIIIP